MHSMPIQVSTPPPVLQTSHHDLKWVINLEYCQTPDKNKSRIFRGIFGILCGISKLQYLYVFIPPFLADTLMFQGSLVLKEQSTAQVSKVTHAATSAHYVYTIKSA
jgi:hypothetical protein